MIKSGNDTAAMSLLKSDDERGTNVFELLSEPTASVFRRDHHSLVNLQLLYVECMCDVYDRLLVVYDLTFARLSNVYWPQELLLTHRSLLIASYLSEPNVFFP